MLKTLFASLLFFIAPAIASANCTPTPQVGVASYPGKSKIISSNRLARPAGKPLYHDGQVVWIRGTLLDSACMPVHDARIELWQVNPYGSFSVATSPELATPDPVFAGTGATYSDNTGRFEFETLYPGEIKGRAPAVNIRITHPDYKRFQTQLFFAGDFRNESDAKIKSLSETKKEQLIMPVIAATEVGEEGALIVEAEVTIPGQNPWKQF